MATRNVRQDPQQPGQGAVLGYAAGSFGAGLYATVPGILLLYYFSEQLGLPLAQASLAILLPKLVVIVADPSIGVWSDRTQSRWGRRRPFLFGGAILSALTFVALFSVRRVDGDGLLFLMVTLAYLLFSLSHSLFAVPYVAMPAEMTDDPSLRARIIGLRMSFVLAGAMVGASVPPILVEALGGGPAAYAGMSIAIAAVCLLSMLTATAAAARLATGAGGAQATDSSALGSVISYVPYLGAVLVYLLIMIGTGIASAAAPYFVTYALGWPESRLGLILGTQVLTSILCMALWARAVPRIGYISALNAALLISACGNGLYWFCTGETLGLLITASVIAGVGLAGVQVTAFSLLAAIIRSHNEQRQVSLEGLMTGLWTASEKVALAVGPSLCGMILALGGFVSRAGGSGTGTGGAGPSRFAISVGPIALWAIAFVVLALFAKRLRQDPGQAKA